jgi:hypothetical protein
MGTPETESMSLITNKEKRFWNKTTIAILIAVLLMLGVIIIIILSIVVLHYHKHPSMYDQCWNNKHAWYTVNYVYGKNNIATDNACVMNVTYAQGTFQNSGGFKFYVTNSQQFPANSTCMKYEVYFPSNFPWTKGGKLPGVWIGDMGANGGKRITDGFSCRFMWRSNGLAEVYLYIPENQTSEYKKQIISKGAYGDSLWRGSFILRNGSWNQLQMCISLNSKDDTNGMLDVTINNATKFLSTIRFRTNDSQKLNGFMMQSFFGGNDVSWATPIDTYAIFRNFNATTN